ncbi:MAG: preprotein translocase subunit SecY [Candidatus Lokiarchaeota archaeon]|nr:preprotein translocase subunit SecY [Candidatus Lokiarchaeota archaeon]
MPSKFLSIFKPLCRIMPEVKQPDREVSFKEKFFWTAIVLVIYLFMSQIPVFGVDTSGGVDPFFWLRVILASNRGSLTELGIGPIVTAGLIMQLLQGSKLIKVDLTSPEDRALFTGTQKVMAIALTIFQIIAYLLAGAFGQNLTPDRITFIFLQLLASGIIIILLDEVIQKGWGIGSGVSLFIAAGVAGQILWSAFSFLPATYPNPNADLIPNNGDETIVQMIGDDPNKGLMRGAIIAFFQSLTWGDAGASFFRPGGLPTMFGVIVTAVIFFIVVYVETIKVEIPLQYTGYRGFGAKYPIKLMYVSNIPVILAQALYANVLFFGQLIAGPNSALRAQATGNPVFTFLLDLIGTVNPEANTQNMFNNGLIYYLTPPRGLEAVGLDPVRAIIYFVIFLVLCVYFGQIWVDVSGLAPRDIAQQILDSGMSIPGFRNSAKPIERILKRYIPTLTILCGIIVAVLAFTADAFDALGSGTGILLTVGIMHNYAEQISKEAAAEQYPALRGFLGLD